ncbi:DUF3919 family protein [Paenibacillus radicis (ex Xue et al. 2023)]|uniref:DUF3919 family protein n=1 Tax=Paenibacillus radicis (ex Xue et al. 2023) TaxID=2972489 RepID=A0ABT1YH56_9BACL|nr:DUF3919 family protein [Paenibacillus radicis (ex Xue et al. 2023)]MCR8632530.1 DUF3919 family protein [Paenibacillus radicis (ex Xue et al. 2023)]
MPGEKKGLSWFRLILLQVVVACILVGICAYAFRIPYDEVHVVPPQQDGRDMFAGVPMRVDVTYPGLGTISIDEPKELLKLKSSFAGLLVLGKQQNSIRPPRLLLTGVMAYLDQEDIPFQIETNTFRFGQESVNSLNVSAEIRKLQSILIDKTLTSATVGMAIDDSRNEVFALQNGELTLLSRVERAELTAQVEAAVRVIDFSHFDDLAQQPDAHYVIQLADDHVTKKHWIHIDRYNNAYIVVFDLLDETNQRAYFKLNDAS